MKNPISFNYSDLNDLDCSADSSAILSKALELSLPVANGFIVGLLSSKDCDIDAIQIELDQRIKALELESGLTFGEGSTPLILSLRLEYPNSSQGEISLLQNLGFNDSLVEELASNPSKSRWAYDSYRRLIESYSSLVENISIDDFYDCFDDYKDNCGYSLDLELSSFDLKELCKQYKQIFKEQTGKDFPQDPRIQLHTTVEKFSTFHKSSFSKNGNEPAGLLIHVQQMFFGNFDKRSGVLNIKSREEGSGNFLLNGTFLNESQEDDLKSGLQEVLDLNYFKKHYPDRFKEVNDCMESLDRASNKALSASFVIQEEKLVLVWVDTLICSPQQELKIAYSLVQEGRLTTSEALKRVKPEVINTFLSPVFAEQDKSRLQEFLGAHGQPVSFGAASGKLALSLEAAEYFYSQGEAYILVKEDTSPADFKAMSRAVGILTSRGGATSHAAIMARQFGKPCVSNVADLSFDLENKQIRIGSVIYSQGSPISIDGSIGNVYLKELPVTSPSVIQVLAGSKPEEDCDSFKYFKALSDWSKEHASMGVRVNADSAEDYRLGAMLGASGVGLARIEHMFRSPERLLVLQKLFLSSCVEELSRCLSAIEDFLVIDLQQLFVELKGRPLSIRLLDPPLHEFMPQSEGDKQALASALDLSMPDFTIRLAALEEKNPMLGHRGCRLAISSPAVTSMQVRAIITAAFKSSSYRDDQLEILVPTVMAPKEFEYAKSLINDAAQTVFDEYGKRLDFTVGTMIELPRAALLAGDLAKSADFFSFGTNDLTQTTLGLSRDDASSFLGLYSEPLVTDNGDFNSPIFKNDPFLVLDQKGVGELIHSAIKRGRSVKPKLKMGVCGEHAADPSSIDFFHKIGMDYLSCSPFRVAMTCVAAAQAALKSEI